MFSSCQTAVSVHNEWFAQPQAQALGGKQHTCAELRNSSDVCMAQARKPLSALRTFGAMLQLRVARSDPSSDMATGVVIQVVARPCCCWYRRIDRDEDRDIASDTANTPGNCFQHCPQGISCELRRVTSCTRSYNSCSMHCTPAAATASNSSVAADGLHKTSRSQGHLMHLSSEASTCATPIRQTCSIAAGLKSLLL